MKGNIQSFDAGTKQTINLRENLIRLTIFILLMMMVLARPANAAIHELLKENSRRPTLKLSPTVRATNYREYIQAIDPRAIQAYLNAPLVIDNNELNEAGYIIGGVDSRLLMGKYDQFYARGLKDQSVNEYQVFRVGRHFIDPISNESLGWEAQHVGDARMLQSGDPARLSLLKTYGDVAVEDKLRPLYKSPRLPFFHSKAPKNRDIRGLILSAQNTLSDLGPQSVVVLNLGERDQVSAGDVFRILSQSHLQYDPIVGEAYRLPEEKIGLLVVFRIFEKVSYALVTSATRAITLYDIVVSPEAE